MQTLISAIILALFGYIATYVNNIIIDSRKSKLKFISDQIQYLYGPLFALSDASDQAWTSFRSRCRPHGSFFGKDPPPSDEELGQWRLWMAEIFMPINLKIEKIIIENAHLIDGSGMPAEFREFLAHVEVYKITVKNWERADYRENVSYSNYPVGFNNLIEDSYGKLKKAQAKMIGMQ